MPRFNAGQLATAWLNVAQATGDDDHRPIMYRTTLLEIHTEGVRLVATDGLLLLYSWVPYASDDLANPPAERTKPSEAHIVMDPDKRMLDLMKFMRREAKEAAKVDRSCHVDLSIQQADDPGGQQVIDSMLAPFVFRASTDRERLELPTFDSKYPDWRAVVKGAKPEATATVKFSTDTFVRLGRLLDIGALTLEPSGAIGLVSLTGSEQSDHYLWGGVMPLGNAEGS